MSENRGEILAASPQPPKGGRGFWEGLRKIVGIGVENQFSEGKIAPKMEAQVEPTATKSAKETIPPTRELGIEEKRKLLELKYRNLPNNALIPELAKVLDQICQDPAIKSDPDKVKEFNDVLQGLSEKSGENLAHYVEYAQNLVNGDSDLAINAFVLSGVILNRPGLFVNSKNDKLEPEKDLVVEEAAPVTEEVTSVKPSKVERNLRRTKAATTNEFLQVARRKQIPIKSGSKRYILEGRDGTIVTVPRGPGNLSSDAIHSISKFIDSQ